MSGSFVMKSNVMLVSDKISIFFYPFDFIMVYCDHGKVIGYPYVWLPVSGEFQ
jgi:hypothetical protein